MKRRRKEGTHKIDRKLLVKELVFSALAVLSVGLLLWELLDSPTDYEKEIIYLFDFGVALIFLADYVHQLYYAKQKWTFVRHNWFLLLASIPLTASWAEALHGLRLLALVRLFRAGEHVLYARKIIRNDVPKQRRSKKYHGGAARA